MNRKLFSIVIPIYNALEYLKRTVSSIRKYSSDYELILVDNGSNKETKKYLKSLKNVKLITLDKNYGFSRAVNLGILNSCGKYICVLNSDVIFLTEWENVIKDIFNKNRKIMAVGPLTNRTYGVQKIVFKEKMNMKKYRIFANLINLKYKNDFFKVHRLVGFCMFFREEIFRKIGLFDERFETGCYEDFDISLRIRQAGYGLAVAKGLFVYHNHHSSFNDYSHFYSCAIKNRKVFIDKWCRKALEFLDELDPFMEIPSDFYLKNGKDL